MHILRIEHAVPSFEAWKQAFDRDPVGREQGGVRRYQILRSVNDPNYVMIDLEFDSLGQAETFLAALRAMWGRVDVVRDPGARIVEMVDRQEL